MVDENRQPEPDGQPPGGLEHPSVRYELSDVKFRWILGLLLGAMVFAAVVFFVVLRFYHDYAAYEARIKVSQYPLSTDNGRLPPEPRLEQVNRLANIEKGNGYLREKSKEQILHSYGSLPGEEGYVRVPVERGRRGNGLVDGGESNSGRLLREKAPWYEP
jgi:hypothetical protein